MQATRSLLILDVLNAHLLEKSHYGQVPMVAGIVKATETVHICLVYLFSHRALQHNLRNVQSNNKMWSLVRQRGQYVLNGEDN